MNSDTILKKLKEEAQFKSMQTLQKRFNKPDDLELIPFYIKKTEKNLNDIKAKFKLSTTFYSTVLDEVKRVKSASETIYSIEEDYKSISDLEIKLNGLKTEVIRYKQLKFAKENINRILDVPELSIKAFNHLEKNELLLAHICLLELEKCRNDILVELANDNLSDNDVSMVNLYFKDLKEIQKRMSSEVYNTISRMLNVSRKNPKQLVTALRIIEREEILDEDWLKKKSETGFMPTDRPKKYKNKCYEQIIKLVESRVYGSRCFEREQDSLWFSKHLGNLADILVKDLEIVQELCVPCFPPSYNIFDYFIDTVHGQLSSYLKEIVNTNQLESGSEYFVLLSWIDTYKSKHFMGNPKLRIDTNKIKDLLDSKTYETVLKKHMEHMKHELTIWFFNLLSKNVSEWSNKDYKPNYDDDKYYQSHLLVDLHSIVSEKLSLTKHANDDRVIKAFMDCLYEELKNFLNNLKDELIKFTDKHFQNVNKLKNTFAIRMVILSNDCAFIGERVRSEFTKFMDGEKIDDHYQALINGFDNLSEMSLDYIIQDMLKYHEHCFKILFTPMWLEGDKTVTTIIATSNDYLLNDLIHLKPNLCYLALYKWCTEIKVQYMKRLLQNYASLFPLSKNICVNVDERRKFANKFSKDITVLEEWFNKSFEKTYIQNDKNPYDFLILKMLVKILELNDLDFLGVEIATLVSKYPEFNSDLVFALLVFRGDVKISKSEFKDKFGSYFIVESKSERSKKKPDEAVVLLKRQLNAKIVY